MTIDATQETRKISIARLAEALELIWTMIRDAHPDVPEVVLVPGASGTSTGRTVWGHHWADRWETFDGRRVPEIMVSGESFGRKPEEILGTVLHEAAHAVAKVRGVKDTSRGGRYHNRKFQAIAEKEFGLSISHDPQIGYSITTVPAETVAKYETGVKALAEALCVKRLAEPGRGAKAKGESTKNGIVLVCKDPHYVGCGGRRLRLSVTAAEAGDIVCGPCGVPFEVQEDDDK